MPELVAPTTGLQGAWLEAHTEWGDGLHEDGFGLSPFDDVATPTGFATWVARLHSRSQPAEAAGHVGHRCVYRWIVENDRVLGGIALRHGVDDDYVSWAGHLGFGIRPSARGRALASWAVGRMLDEARRLEMERVLAVCAVENTASAKTIEHCGGVLEEIRDTEHGRLRRYWIEL